MGVILEQIQKAEQKARELDTDVASLAATARWQTPAQLASGKAIQDRRDFLHDSLHDNAVAERFFERILAGNELQDFNYLERGSVAGRAVARILIRPPSEDPGWGTGFLIAGNVLLTNNHVLPSHAYAVASEAHFGYERDYVGTMTGPYVFHLDPDRLFYTCKDLDFTVVAVSEEATNAPLELAQFGCLPLVSKKGKAVEGEWLTIIQHPDGQAKQLCVRENKFIKRTQNELWYSADTLAGSSGSPVFNNDWYVVALHHSGMASRKNGRVQTVDGRDFDEQRDGEDQIKWIANEGIRASSIVDRLRTERGNHPLLQPVFDASPESARIGDHAKRAFYLPPLTKHSANPPSTQKESTMPTSVSNADRTINVTLSIDTNGTVSLLDSSLESTDARKRRAPEPEARRDAPFDSDYSSRQGFQEDFFGSGYHKVLLPELQPGLKAKAAMLLNDPGDCVLKYHNFSVVMHAARRLAIYSAANVSAGSRFQLSRPGDEWRTDPRIAAEAQLGNFYYKNNKFDRGHLTRREDLEFGATPVKALQSAADTLHWTNCVPQQEKFNQTKEFWQGLERFVLEEGIYQNRLNIQVFTGPIFEEDDPVYERFPKIQYPLRFWKVIVAPLDGGGISATGYVMDQSEAIDLYGIETTVPFGAYGNAQMPIDVIEELTQLKFAATDKDGKKTSLSAFDPLHSQQPRRRTALRLQESAAATRWPNRAIPLTTFDDIILGSAP